MAKRRSWNPIAFVPIQVTLISSAVYIALFAILIWVHETVPSAPSDPTPVKGINLTDAWLDLSYITNGFHPIDSRRNEEVREYLLLRIGEILEKNEVDYKTIKTQQEYSDIGSSKKHGPKPVTVFDDRLSNVTFVDDFRQQPWSCYSESDNVLVYIRGQNDPEGDFWYDGGKYSGQSGVLVNAHYDSVASGYGATDDGVGVITILQLISYFTTKDNQPKRGIVALLNNGEENGLYGAHNYLRHPISQFTHTFLNLEGAGAGGRATLFRSTDAEVTKFYSQSPHPFGNVLSGDGFKRGYIRSGTDFSVFNGDNGMRGLDVAFFSPRARYHTDQDAARETNADSVWHMLSASLATTKAMTSYDGDEFEGTADRKGKLDLANGNDGVWFDFLGTSFAVMRLTKLFALSVALLTAGPLILLALEVTLRRSDKWYPLARRQYIYSSDDDDAVHFSGVRGLSRFPIAFVAATAAVLALVYLIAKINPYIIYSSEYAVWSMMLSAWFAVAWFFFAGADRIRPTALQRMFTLIWMYALSWLVLVAVTVGENNFQIASGYFLVIYNLSVFLALLISYLELFALPTKTTYVDHVADVDDEIERRSVRPSSQYGQSGNRGHQTADDAEDEATERTSLLPGGDRHSGHRSKRARHPDTDGTLEETEDPTLIMAYGDEQAWSSSLPQWSWILQFLILAPVNIVLVGQISLLMTTALHQTPADGNSVIPIYLFVAVLTVLLLLPLSPFLHRFSYLIPTLLLLIFAGSLLYNLLAFPFSRENRLKVYFVQGLNLDPTGATNTVTLSGLDGYVQTIIGELPSAAGQSLTCDGDNAKAGQTSCSWAGLSPHVVTSGGLYSTSHNGTDYQTWLEYNVTHSGNWAHFTFQGRDTKQCRLAFDNPVSEVNIQDAADDPRYGSAAKEGSSQVRLFSRTWEKTFRVNVTWADTDAKNQTGDIICSYSDANTRGAIPAFDELREFGPVWSAATKASDGLVEVHKAFKV